MKTLTFAFAALLTVHAAPVFANCGDTANGTITTIGRNVVDTRTVATTAVFRGPLLLAPVGPLDLQPYDFFGFPGGHTETLSLQLPLTFADEGFLPIHLGPLESLNVSREWILNDESVMASVRAVTSTGMATRIALSYELAEEIEHLVPSPHCPILRETCSAVQVQILSVEVDGVASHFERKDRGTSRPLPLSACL